MMQAYFDCFSGISGDMTLGALVDLGAPLEWLEAELARLPLGGFRLAATSVVRSGLTARRVTVEPADPGAARDFKKIRALLKKCPLTENVKSKSLKIFGILAGAEARIHDCDPDQVHFHEVGGVDAIVDIVGTALCLEKLGIKKVFASRIPLGSGFVDCRHGRLPLPAPATLEILKEVPVYGTDIAHELVTPTGAAIIRGLTESFGRLPPMHVTRIGYGAGQRELADRPNLLRVLMGTPADLNDNIHTDQIFVLETAVDDMNPELFGFIMERLFEDGALDVYWIPVQMKKNRPGTIVQVLCRADCSERLIHRLLAETTSLGVRYYPTTRKLLAREQQSLRTSLGEVQVKQVKDPDGNFRFVPEYEICRRIALQRKIPLRDVYDIISREAVELHKKKV